LKLFIDIEACRNKTSHWWEIHLGFTYNECEEIIILLRGIAFNRNNRPHPELLSTLSDFSSKYILILKKYSKL